MAAVEEPPGAVALASQTPLGELVGLFEEPLWAEVFAACCCDAGEAPQLGKAQSFRDALVAQNPNGLRGERLSLRCLRIGAVAASCLAQQLRDRGHTWLDLSSNQLADHAMLSVRTLVCALPRLRWLGLAGNLTTAEGVRELAEELESNEILEGLALGSQEPQGAGFRPNVVGSEGLVALLAALRRNARSALTSLTLCRTSLDAAAAKELAAFLTESKGRLHQLNLSLNPLTSEGVSALLPACARLRVLNLADTGCRGELIHPQLCALLGQTTCLSSLCLAQNPLEARPLRRIARAVAGCASLTSLSLECTSLDAEGVTAICDALLAAPVQSLTELDLSDNQLAQAEASTALAHLVARSALRTLRLGRNPLGDAGARALGEALDPALSPDAPLRCLELGSCRLGVLGAGHLLACLAHNATLRVLCLSDNFLDDSLDPSLIEGLEFLQDLQLSGNRLSFAAVQRATQVCARNRQRERDREPEALKAEIRRLLPEEARLGVARRRVGEDEALLGERRDAAERTSAELQQLRVQAQEQQRNLQRQLLLAEATLHERREELQRARRELEAATAQCGRQQGEFGDRLKEREKELVELQVSADQIDTLLERRKAEHPREVISVKARIKAAVEDTDQLHSSASDMRKHLQALQDKSLIDFRP